MVHDKFRIDKRGRGTFDRTLEKNRNIDTICALSVANPNYSPKMIFDFFHNELGLKQFDFLMPDAHHNDLPPLPIEDYAKFYISLFKESIKEENKGVRIRFIRNLIQSFFMKDSLIYGQGGYTKNLIHPITISSSGDLAPVDDLRNSNPKFMDTNKNINNTSLTSFLREDIFKTLEYFFKELPSTCQGCCWSNICKGGNIIHRYSKKNLFSNESVYCAALKDIYGEIAAQLIKDGYPFDKMEKVLAFH